MKLFGIRVWPWHTYSLSKFRLSMIGFSLRKNFEGGITITFGERLFYTSDLYEERKTREKIS